MREDDLPLLVNYRQRSHTNRIILHESHTPDSVLNCTALMRARGRVNGLLEIGYHFIIEMRGTTVQTREDGTVGSHAPTANHDSIGICLAGDHDSDWWGEERIPQMIALHSLVHFLLVDFGDLRILGHDEAVKRLRTKHNSRCPSLDMDVMRKFLGSPLRDDP